MTSNNHPTPLRVTSTLISASAGTGKTYQLSLRFISLLALGVLPEAMAAITFTRKAAGEFSDRILRDIAAGADTEEGAASLRLRILDMWRGRPGFPGLSPDASEEHHPLMRESFRHLLRLLVDALGRLRLSTIDSLFASLVRMSSFELGLSEVRMVDEASKAMERRNALEYLYMGCQESEHSMKEFLDRFSDMARNRARADMETTLQEIVDAYHAAYLQAPAPEIWGNLAAFGLTLDEETAPLSDTFWADTAAEMDRLLPLANISGKRAKNAYESARDKLLDESWNLASIKTLETDIAQTDGANEAYLRLKDLVRNLIAATEREALRIVRDKSRALPEILGQYETVYRKRVRSRGLYDFEDITRSLPEVLGRDGAPSVLAYRMDGRIRHWMLDEFQDTSRVQWEGLHAFLEEVATEAGENGSAARSLFVVGDVKQSIYGWRGGEPKLFHSLQTETPWKEALRECSMTTSYRSSSVVLDFVNLVFGYAGAAAHRAAGREEGGRERAGRIEIYRLPKAKAEENMQLACETAVGILRGLPLRTKRISCAVLLRKGEEVDTMRDWIRAHLPGIDVESLSDVHVAVDTPLGMTLLQFFRWLQHPGNDYAAAIVRQSPLGGEVFGSLALPAAWSLWQNRLAEQGYAAVIRRLRDALLHHENLLSPCHRDRLDIWMNDAENFDTKGGSLDEWILRMLARTQAGNPPRSFVHVMTIHKSKGLEYDAIILPLLGTKAFDDQSRLDNFKTVGQDGQMTGFLFAPPKAVRERYPQLSPHIEEWAEKQRQEGRNLLYVALTRAAHANYIILPNKPSTGSAGSLILEGIETAGETIAERGGEETELVYASGENGWHGTIAQEKENLEEMPLPPLPAPQKRRTRIRPSVLDDDDGAPQAEDGDSAKARHRRERLALGHEIHAVFERIEWWNPADLPEWAHAPSTDAERIVLDCLREPEIALLFEKKPGAVALREQRLEAVAGDHWTSAVIDRLVVHADGTATVIDYKTGAAVTEEQLKTQYAQQMENYGKLAATALNIPGGETGVRLCILSTDMKRLIRL